MTIRTKRILHAVFSTATSLLIAWLLAYAHAGDLICIETRTMMFVLMAGALASAGWGAVLGGRNRNGD